MAKLFKQVILLILLALMLSACATGDKSAGTPGSDAAPPKAFTDTPLASAYDTIIFYDFNTTPEFQKDYGADLETCQFKAIATLRNEKKYKEIDENSGDNYGTGTLLVKVNVPKMRIVSGSARFWGGALAGSSEMTLEIDLIDAATNRVVGEKELSSASNPWAAAYTGGSNDRSLPSDMGVMLAEYLLAVVPASQ